MVRDKQEQRRGAGSDAFRMILYVVKSQETLEQGHSSRKE